jgi:hypothetical protein
MRFGDSASHLRGFGRFRDSFQFQDPRPEILQLDPLGGVVEYLHSMRFGFPDVLVGIGDSASCLHSIGSGGLLPIGHFGQRGPVDSPGGIDAQPTCSLCFHQPFRQGSLSHLGLFWVDRLQRSHPRFQSMSHLFLVPRVSRSSQFRDAGSDILKLHTFGCHEGRHGPPVREWLPGRWSGAIDCKNESRRACR